jgi:phosphosulfolactate synthase
VTHSENMTLSKSDEQPFSFLALPKTRSSKKPRRVGLTMMIDQGLPAHHVNDIVECAGAYIDLAKIKTGTARLYPERVLRTKLEHYKANDIKPFIGGQFHEYVVATTGGRSLNAFYAEAIRLGFAAIEVSDNVIPLTDQARRQHIQRARDAGLEVFGEVGGKDRRTSPQELLDQAAICLEAGASLVLVEAAELVDGGKIDQSLLKAIVNGLSPESVMLELPGPWIPDVRTCDIEALKKLLVQEFGPDVNIANVSPDTVLDFEATRNGLGVAGPLASQFLEQSS